VLSTGGGAFLAPRNRELISKHGVAVWLRVELNLLWARVRHRGTRPLLQTADPKATLERLHAERYLVRPRSFESCLSTGTVLPDLHHPADAVLQALEDDLNDWFDTHKRGRGTRVFPFVKEDGVWFLIRHGEPFKREGTIENGESSSVFYRPEKFDVLIYNPALGELAIHAGTKGEKKAYCKYLGKHLFGSETFFAFEGVDGKYSLEPIRTDGAACLVCRDIERIDGVQLAELQFRHSGHLYHVEIHKADDVFAALDSIARQIPPSAVLLRASFKVSFTGTVRPRTVVIRPPNLTMYDRESDSALLERWMIARGFIRTGEVSVGDESGAAVVAS